ncbi:MAG: hypothetical protein R2856_29465 [Caldilineaceae bacterium]
MNLPSGMSKYRKEKQPDVFEAVRLLADEVMDHIAELDRLRNQLRSPVDSAANRTVDDIRGTLLSIEGRGSQKILAGHRQVAHGRSRLARSTHARSDRSV